MARLRALTVLKTESCQVRVGEKYTPPDHVPTRRYPATRLPMNSVYMWASVVGGSPLRLSFQTRRRKSHANKRAA